MARYILARLIQSIVLLWVVTVAVFAIIRQAPGGPAILADPNLGRDDIERMEETLGLDRPIHIQYGEWLGRTLKGDWGTSFNHSQPVMTLILQRVPNTLILGFASMTIAIGIGLPLGVLSAVKRNSVFDYLGTVFSLFNLSVPAFWFGIILIIIFAVELGWLPSGGMGTVDDKGLLNLIKHLILPAIVASGFMMARLARFTRTSVIEVLNEDYVRTARSKGLSEFRVLFVHVLRNGLIPVVTVLGLTFPQIVAGAAITETVFAWPGMGALGVEAAANADYPLIMGITLVAAVTVIISNLLTDLLYSTLDPRVRLG
jgi:peptide/nickel transport system permease protein